MIRASAFQIRAITRPETHQPEKDVDDAHGARGGDAKTNMGGWMMIAINSESMNLLNRGVSGFGRVIGSHGL